MKKELNVIFMQLFFRFDEVGKTQVYSNRKASIGSSAAALRAG